MAGDPLNTLDLIVLESERLACGLSKLQAALEEMILLAAEETQ